MWWPGLSSPISSRSPRSPITLCPSSVHRVRQDPLLSFGEAPSLVRQGSHTHARQGSHTHVRQGLQTVAVRARSETIAQQWMGPSSPCRQGFHTHVRQGTHTHVRQGLRTAAVRARIEIFAQQGVLPLRSCRQGPLLSFDKVPFSRSARSPSLVRQGLQTAAVRAGRRPSPIKRRDICPSRKAGDWPWAFCWRWVVVLYYLHGGCYGYTPRGGIEDEKAENSSSRSPPHPASGPVHGAATRSVAVV